MKLFHSLALMGLASLFLLPRLALAGGDHEHGQADSAALGAALPRFAAASDLFELVGILGGKQITLYLDRSADNSPVTSAQIELEIGGKRYPASKLGADQFAVVLGEVPQAGVLPVTALVSAGSDTDLLAAELDIHAATPADTAGRAHAWASYAAWAAGGIALLVAALTFGVRRLSAARQVRAGGVA